MSHKKGNDNELLVEFDFLVDLDMALFRLVKDKYSNSEWFSTICSLTAAEIALGSTEPGVGVAGSRSR